MHPSARHLASLALFVLLACACSDHASTFGIDASDVVDAAPDNPHIDVASPIDAGPPGPRALAPLSTSTVTSQQPTLRWVPAAGTDGTRIALCRDRAMSTGCLPSIAGTGASTRAPTLAGGAWFWQLLGTSSATAVTAPSVVWQFTVGSMSAIVDTSWGSVLDVNGDGFADVAASAVGAMTGTGRVDVFLGGASGVDPSEATQLNGLDGTTGAFGSSIASAGDVDGDGFADLVVGAYTALNESGRAYVYRGGVGGLESTPMATLTGPGGEDGLFGASVAGIGDVNGDGYADIAIGAPIASGSGAAYVFLGSATGPLTMPSMMLAGSDGEFERFGSVVASAGDVNADGFGDLAVGAPGSMGGGEAFLYLGSASGIAPTPALTLAGIDGTTGAFGSEIANAGDLNGDGFADMIIAAPGASMHAGRAYVYLGGASGPSPHASTVLAGPDGALGGFGAAMASAGDVNGDGYGDVVVGASGAQMATGSVYVFLGSATGLVATAANSITGSDGPMGTFGSALTIAGDANGDGFADVAVGASGAPGGMGMGRTYVFLGSELGLGNSASTTLSVADTAAGYFGNALARVPPRTSVGARASAPRAHVIHIRGTSRPICSVSARIAAV